MSIGLGFLALFAPPKENQDRPCTDLITLEEMLAAMPAGLFDLDCFEHKNPKLAGRVRYRLPTFLAALVFRGSPRSSRVCVSLSPTCKSGLQVGSTPPPVIVAGLDLSTRPTPDSPFGPMGIRYSVLTRALSTKRY